MLRKARAVGARGGGQRRVGARGKRLAGPRREVRGCGKRGGEWKGGGNRGSGAGAGAVPLDSAWRSVAAARCEG